MYIDERACGSTQALLEHRWSCIPSGHFPSVELTSDDSHVAAVKSSDITQDRPVWPLLRLLTPRTVSIAIPSSDSVNYCTVF